MERANNVVVCGVVSVDHVLQRHVVRDRRSIVENADHHVGRPGLVCSKESRHRIQASSANHDLSLTRSASTP